MYRSGDHQTVEVLEQHFCLRHFALSLFIENFTIIVLDINFKSTRENGSETRPKKCSEKQAQPVLLY